MPYLSVTYSMPEWILNRWLRLYDFETVETICKGIHKDHVTTVRCNLNKASKKDIMESLRNQGVTVMEHPYLDYALNLFDYNYLKALDAFRNGWIQVQDVSSMLVAEVAAPKWEITASTSAPLPEENPFIWRTSWRAAVSWRPGILPSPK